MIKVVAKEYLKTDKMAEFEEVALGLVQETNAKDAGCISYALFRDLSDPQLFTFIEEWVDQQALDRHMSAPHFIAATTKLRAFVERPAEINLYQKLA